LLSSAQFKCYPTLFQFYSEAAEEDGFEPGEEEEEQEEGEGEEGEGHRGGEEGQVVPAPPQAEGDPLLEMEASEDNG
jgi:hypothetical protein